MEMDAGAAPSSLPPQALAAGGAAQLPLPQPPAARALEYVTLEQLQGHAAFEAERNASFVSPMLGAMLSKIGSIRADPAYAGDAILVQSHWVKALRLAEGAVGRTMPALRVAAIDGKVSGKRRYEIEQDMAGGGVDVLFLSIGVRAYVQSCSIRARVRALAGVPAGARDVGVMLLLRRHVTRAGGGRRRQRA